MKHANMLAPATMLAPMGLDNDIVDHTALRGRSFVHTGSVHVNSEIIVGGTNRVVPRMLHMIIRGHANSRGRMRVPDIYPRYN